METFGQAQITTWAGQNIFQTEALVPSLCWPVSIKSVPRMEEGAAHERMPGYNIDRCLGITPVV